MLKIEMQCILWFGINGLRVKEDINGFESPPHKRRRLGKCSAIESCNVDVDANKCNVDCNSGTGLTEDEMIELAIQRSLQESQVKQCQSVKLTDGTIQQCDLCGKDVMCLQSSGFIFCATCNNNLGV